MAGLLQAHSNAGCEHSGDHPDGQGDISTARSAPMRQGAYDFIEKPFHHDGLDPEILPSGALEKRHLAWRTGSSEAQLRP